MRVCRLAIGDVKRSVTMLDFQVAIPLVVVLLKSFSSVKHTPSVLVTRSHPSVLSHPNHTSTVDHPQDHRPWTHPASHRRHLVCAMLRCHSCFTKDVEYWSVFFAFLLPCRITFSCYYSCDGVAGVQKYIGPCVFTPGDCISNYFDCRSF